MSPGAIARRAYVLLPPIARDIAATLRGAYLRAWRYGPDLEARVAAALERERWSERQWQDWREERLAFLLHRARTVVPYYTAHWAARRRAGDTASWDELRNWPVLEKETLRERPLEFIATDRDRRWMFHEHASGTTGTPLDLWRSRETVRAWYALCEARWRRWYGVSDEDRWAIFGGQVIIPAAQTRPPYWVWNAALRQLYCSAYHVGRDSAAAYAAELRQRRVRYVLGYPSAIHALATACTDLGLEAPPLAVAVANAEPVYPHQRRSVEAAFGCALRETYGLAEIVTAAGECEHGTMHLWPEVGVVEVLRGAEPLPRGETGDLVATGLVNEDMPLIRYRIGDRGSLPAKDARCACGRTLPALAGVEGRSDDVLYTASGHIIGRLDPVFKEHLPIREAQIIQERLDLVRIRYVPAAGFTPAAGRSMADRLRERMGEVRVELESVPAIEREPNGKFRAVICRLPPGDRARLSAR